MQSREKYSIRKFLILGTLLFVSITATPHGFGGSGFLHPLTGIDHLIAMIAVGGWSAQLGGKAIWFVPAAFLLMMLAGGLTGISQITVAGTEAGIALSVLLLGFAIAINKKAGWFTAALAVGLFGFCHGYAHGAAIPQQQNIPEYISGFLITTFGLHVVGAVGGLILLEEKNGRAILRYSGLLAFLTGIYLIGTCM